MQDHSPSDIHNGNARPYCVSVDWLSLSCRDSGFVFWDKEAQPSGYKIVHLSHGSKVFKDLFEVYDPDGQLIGELHSHPWSSAMNERSCIFKSDNALLYQPDAVEQIFACLTALALEYRGINRLDLCCDQSEFYGGLLPQNLLDKYFHRKLLKLGTNHGINFFDLGYYGTTGNIGGRLHAWSKMPIPDPKRREAEQAALMERNEALRAVGLKELDPSPARHIDELPAIVHNSVTWGTRGNGVQVQLYNKTKELQEKKLKHYIVDAWRACGLDLQRDVYRVEIRIHGRGKGVINPQTGEEFQINLTDVIMQQQVEELFFAFAERHFKFFRADGKVKLRQNRPVQLWQRRDPVLKPKQTKPHKDPTRFVLVLANAVSRELVACEKQDKRAREAGLPSPTADYIKPLQKVQGYFRDAYNIAQWMQDQDLEHKFTDGETVVRKPVSYRTSRAWTMGRIAEEVQSKVRAWMKKYRPDRLREFREREAEHMTYARQQEYFAQCRRLDERLAASVVDPQEVFALRDTGYVRAVESSLASIVYPEYINKDLLSFDPPSYSEIDWDNLSDDTPF